MKYLDGFAKVWKKIAFLGASLSMVAFSPAMAGSTDWQQTVGGGVRLIAAGQSDGRYRAGLEITLDEGWKTYWKIPGETGIPPTLDFSGSVNVSRLDIAWPVPTRIDVAGSQILGYKDAIVIPVFITPEDPSKPVDLKLEAQIGLCSELCVPLLADLDLPIAAGGDRDTGSALLIDRDLALVPGMPRDDFRVTLLEQEKREGQADRIIINTRIPDGYGKKDLFVEGPQSWLLPLAEPVRVQAGENQQFELILDGLPKSEQSKGKKLTFILTNGDEAVKQSFTLNK